MGNTHFIGHILHSGSCEHQAVTPNLTKFPGVSYLCEVHLSNAHEQQRWEAGFRGCGDRADLRRVVVIVPK